MKESEQNFSPESIDQLTERFFGELPTRDSRLIADLYQTYAPPTEENRRSLQRIWSRFEQAQLQEDQREPGSAYLTKGTEEVNVQASRLGIPVHDSFQPPLQLLPRGSRRSLWRRLSSSVAVAVALLLVLSGVLLPRAFFKGDPPTTLAASLPLDGGSRLNQDIAFLVKSSEGGQYLATISYDLYDVGHGWTTTPDFRSQVPANKRTISEGSPVHLVTQQITLVIPLAEQQPHVYAAGQIASVDQSTTLVINKTTGSLIAVLFNNDQWKAPGDQYTVQSYVSSADITALRSLPLPADAPTLPKDYHGSFPPTYYNPAILSTDLQLPKIDPRVKALALQLTAGAPTMYDKAVALETYFRTVFTYSTTVQRPLRTEATAWLLFQSNHSGFCNYFATAMAVMARELGMPARVVVGYTPGTFDAKAQNWVVHNSDAHAWTQIYFAGYGWINFEPSPTFSLPPPPR